MWAARASLFVIELSQLGKDRIDYRKILPYPTQQAVEIPVNQFEARVMMRDIAARSVALVTGPMEQVLIEAF
jgi:hypothetical protein